MDKLKVRVISFHSTPPLLRTLERLFPTSDVSVQRAVDLRGVETKHLLATKLIGHTAANSIQNGRRWHHEIARKGAVGLAHAVRFALSDITHQLLLFEEDCVIHDEDRFMGYVHQLVEHSSEFDVAVLGTLHREQKIDESVDAIEGWIHIKDKFWGLHCVLYSTMGCKKISSALDAPLDMQIDSLYGSMAANDTLTIWGQQNNPCVAQSLHVSSIQDSRMPLAMDSILVTVWALFTVLTTIVATVSLTVLLRRHRADI